MRDGLVFDGKALVGVRWFRGCNNWERGRSFLVGKWTFVWMK